MSILFGAPIDNSSDGYPPMTYYNVNPNPYEITNNSSKGQQRQNNSNSGMKQNNSFMDRNAFTDPISLSFDANIPLIKKKEQFDDSSMNSREYFNNGRPVEDENQYTRNGKYNNSNDNNNDSEYYNEMININKKGIMNMKFNDGEKYKSNDTINNVNFNIKENKVYQVDRKGNDFVRDTMNDQIKKKFIQDALHEPDNSNCKNTKQKIKIQRKKINRYCNLSKDTLWNIIYLFLFIIVVLVLKILYDNKIIRF